MPLSLVSILGALAAVASAVQEPGEPSSVFAKVSSKVGALEARLSEVELEHRQQLSARREAYQQKLQAQKKANGDMSAENEKISESNFAVKKENEALRKQATELQEDNRLWKEDWLSLKANLSTAIELASHTLDKIEADNAVPELKVLDELANDDAEKQAIAAHSQRFREIASSNLRGEDVSLLDVGQTISPKSLLNILDAGLEDMTKEYNEKVSMLDEEYTKLFTIEKETHEELKSTQASLNSEHDAHLALQARLRAAVSHLVETNKHLEEQARALRMYASRLGIRTLPPTHASKLSAAARESPVEPAEPAFRAVASESHPEAPKASNTVKSDVKAPPTTFLRVPATAATDMEAAPNSKWSASKLLSWLSKKDGGK